MNQKLFTAWHEDARKDGGIVLFGYVTWAVDEIEMREKLRSNVHVGWKDLALVSSGIVRNSATERLWGAPVLEQFEQCARDGAYVSAAAKLVMRVGSMDITEEPEVEFSRQAQEQRRREEDRILRLAWRVGIAAGLLSIAGQLLWNLLSRGHLL